MSGRIQQASPDPISKCIRVLTEKVKCEISYKQVKNSFSTMGVENSRH